LKGPLNLASRPFRNTTLPALLTGVGSFVLVVATLAHGYLLWSLVRGGRHRQEGDVRALELREASLRSGISSLRRSRPAPATLAEWRAVKDLVDRRAFSWTGLLSRLEDLLPGDVRVTSIAPSVQKGRTSLDISVRVQAAGEGLVLLRKLQENGDFEDVFPVSTSDDRMQGRQYQYTMHYTPSARPASSAEGGPPARTEENP
jgi:hypothetical protein